MNDSRGARALRCRNCGNKVGQQYPDGHVLSRFHKRVVRVVIGEITCEACGATMRVDRRRAEVVA